MTTTTLRVQPSTDVTCQACGRVAWQPFLEHPHGPYVVCTACGVVRAEPLPTAAEVDARADFWSQRHHLTESRLERQFDPRFQRMAYGHVLKALRPYRGTDEGRLLEVGGAAGGFLDAARRYGWGTTVGVELARDCVAHARDVRGLDVRQGTLDTVDVMDEGPFDAVVMLDVIEHVLDPTALLEAARRVVRPGGGVLVMTPNTAGLGARKLGVEWEAFDPMDHLWLFAPGSLASTCENAGLTPRRHWSMDANPMHLVRRPRPDVPVAAGGVPEAVQRRNGLIRALRGSRVLRLARACVNACLSPFDLGDKLYLVAERR